MAKQKTIVLSGYYGFDNIGDEAVLLSIIQSLKKQMNDVNITVLSHTPEKTSTTYGVQSVNRWKLKEIIKAIRQADLLISGGGSLLQDVTSAKTIPYYLAIVVIAKILGKPVVFYSQGIGPVNKKINRYLIRWVSRGVDHLFVREEQSKQELVRLGVKASKITVAIDPVIGIKPSSEAKKQSIKQPSVGVYLRNWENKEHILKEMRKVVAHLYQEGYHVYGIPMHGHEDLEIAKTLNQLTEGKLEVIQEALKIDDVVTYTKSFDFIIGMRLHSLIIAHALGVPMIGLSYDPKINHFMDEVGQKNYVDVKTFDADKLIALIGDVQAHGVAIKQQMENVNEKIQIKVDAPAKYIKDCLEKRD